MNKKTPLMLALVVAACNSDKSTSPPQFSCATKSTAVTLAAGASQVYSPSADGCLQIPASAAENDYLMVVGNANTGITTVTSTTVALQAPTATAASALRVASPRLVTNRAALLRGLRTSEAVHARLLRSARERMGNLAALRAARNGASRSSLRRDVIPFAPPAVGTVLTIRVPNADSSAAAICDRNQFFTIGAKVKTVTAHAIIVQDTLAPASGFSDADFASFADEFENKIYITDTGYFGTPADIDGGGHIFIVFTPRVNALTSASDATNSGFTAGFFNQLDLFPQTDASNPQNACAQSNVGDYFYTIVPDPSGTVTFPISAADVKEVARGTLAHEFVHMINASTRYNKAFNLMDNTIVGFETAWLDEALAHTGEEVVGRDESGYGDLQPLTGAEVMASASNYQAFFQQNLLRLSEWLGAPSQSSPINSDSVEQGLAYRGAAWSLLRYSADRHRIASDVRTFYAGVVAGPDTGLANLTAHTTVPYDSLYAGWLYANFPSPDGGRDPSLQYLSWDIFDAEAAVVGSYPIAGTDLTVGSQSSCAIQPGAACYYAVSGTSSGTTAANFAVSNAAGGAVTDPGVKVYVLRLK